MYPLIVVGRVIAFLKPLKEIYDVFFFFPFYHTGGAEKYNAALSNALDDKKCIIYFTRKSVNTTFLEDFRNSGHKIVDISKYTDNKVLYFLNFIYRGIISGYINNQRQKTIAFNGQCNFGYKLSTWLNPNVIQLEFIHTFCTLSYIRPPFLQYYKYSISSSQKAIDDHLEYYRKSGVPRQYFDRWRYILYGIRLPAFVLRNDANAPVLKVLFVGRGTFEKRVHLVAMIAQKAMSENLPARFEFMGDVEAGIPDELKPNLHLYGNKSDFNEIFSIYRQCHILLVTSLFEGFPFVVMEAMSQGLAIISTKVGDVPYHVKSEKNGYILSELANENKIVSEAVELIKRIIADRELLKAISHTNQVYAYEQFDMPVFRRNYRELFASL